MYKINKNNILHSQEWVIYGFYAKCDVTGKQSFPGNVKKRQQCAVVNLKNNFSISAKFTSKGVNRQTINCLCIANINQRRSR
jgi:hypothetical protein